LSELAKAHDIPIPGGLTLEESRQVVFRHPKWGSKPLVRLLFIPEKEDQKIRQVEIETGSNFQRHACRFLECELSDHVLLYSEDQMAYVSPLLISSLLIQRFPERREASWGRRWSPAHKLRNLHG
jgi:hypothetical protein